MSSSWRHLSHPPPPPHQMIGGLESCWALLQSRWASVSSAKHTVAVSTTRAQLSITIDYQYANSIWTFGGHHVGDLEGVASLPVALKFLAWLRSSAPRGPCCTALARSRVRPEHVALKKGAACEGEAGARCKPGAAPPSWLPAYSGPATPRLQDQGVRPETIS